MPAIPPHKTDTSDASWDGNEARARVRSPAEREYFERVFAWVDDGADETLKTNWRFIHHEISADGEPGPANVRACITGIAVLNGARGGTVIPEEGRRGVYRHLAAHLRDAGVEPPELRSIPDLNERRYVVSASYSMAMREQRSSTAQAAPGKLVGYAAVYEQQSVPLGGFREIIRRGAFSGGLNEDLRALWNHNSDYVLGRVANGTLRVTDDSVGLRVEIIPPHTQYARDAIELIRTGYVSQMSIGFFVQEDRWTVEDNVPVRYIERAQLVEVSPVALPAYPQTTIEAAGAPLALKAARLKLKLAGGAI